MKETREEILATWDSKGQYSDWYAIDAYDPIEGGIRRLFVGTESDAVDQMRDYYAVPTRKAMQPFYRCSLISISDAKDYFDGKDKNIDERGVYSLTEAAGILGVSRQRVHVMLQKGQLEGRKVGNTWNVYRYSIENRLKRR